VAWATPGNAISSNGSYASASVDGTTTNYLSCTGYGFSIPSGSRIDGITVNVERKSSSTGNGGSRDAAMRIVKAGAIGATDRSTATTYTTADVAEAHGGGADLWGTTWTAADINAANFGAAFAATKPNAAGGAHTITVDVISITVTYTPPPTVASINRASTDPTTAATVDWTVTFSESVSGVDTSDFSLAISGLSGSSIASVSGGPIAYTVTVNTGFGTGTLGLNLVDDDTIVNVAALPLAGSGLGNGNFTGQVYTVNRPPPVASFNVVETGANAVTGLIFTKIAGQNISVDIVALDASNAVVTSFTGAVAVELVDNTSGGACAGLPLIKALASQTFVAGDNGRHALSAGQFEAEARRNVKFRVKYPTASPTITACSGDAFANRPASFTSVQARDLNRTTAGTTRALTNTSDPGTGTVHNAGRPFQIDATAVNGAGTPATTTLYSPDVGQPVAILTQCGGGTPPAACLPLASLGALTLGPWSAAAGIITTTTASYDNLGAFNLELEDQSFSSVDAGDGTATSVRYIRSSTPLTVGRFVPNHFAITAPAITPRSDLAACAASSFTYMGERMDLVFTLRARNFAGTDIANYAGSLAALTLNSAGSYNFGAIDSALPTPLTARLDLSLIPSIAASWSAGVASITAPIAVTRAATPDGPFGSVKIGIAPSDLDGVTLQTFDLDADNNASNERAQVGPATSIRFGRLRLENAVGSEKLDLPIPMQAQYWAGSAFQTNTLDSCTSLNAANIALGNYDGGINATNVGSGNISLGAAFASGFGSLTLTKPTPAPGSPGAVTLTVDLTTEAKSYLKGNWGVATYTANPPSRAAFGLYGSQPANFIYFRENY
jgi:hypothetical protein